MTSDLLLYTYTDKNYYETIEHADWNADAEWRELISKYVSVKYSIRSDEAYIYASFEGKEYPHGGWKIHVSASYEDMDGVLKTVIPVLVKTRVSFKIVRSKKLYLMLSQKPFPRTAYGKLITVYPDDEEQFVVLLKELHIITKKYNGPRVLTDRKYDESNVLYYRYGGIKPLEFKDCDGNVKTFIKDGYGNWIEDIRRPYYVEIPGIVCPVPEEKYVKSLLIEKYDIIDALTFRNTGGVYNAKDKKTGEELIIKESRPYTALDENGNDAISIRKREYALLEELKDSGYVPRVREALMDSGHFFLVEEKIQGESLHDFVMYKSAYIYGKSSIYVKRYLIEILDIFKNIAKALVNLEDRLIHVCDISSDNIIIEPGHSIKFIDLEGWGREKNVIMTKNLFDLTSAETPIREYGKLFFFSVFGKGELLDVNKTCFYSFWEDLEKEYSLPKCLFNFNKKCFENAYTSAREVCTEIENVLGNVSSFNIARKRRFDKKIAFGNILERGINGIESSKGKIKSAKYPHMPVVKNDYNYSTGRLGIDLALSKIGDKEIDIWKDISDELKRDDDPLLGLYNGVCGCIWILLEIENAERALELSKRYWDEEKIQSLDDSLYSGKAGVGLTCIKLYRETGEPEWLERAKKLESEMRNRLQEQKCISYGLKKGLTGISLFYLYLYLVTEIEEYLQFGKEYLLKDIQGLKKMGKSNAIGMKAFDDDIKSSPYFMEGSSGFLSVLVRYAYVTNDNILYEKAKAIANSIKKTNCLSSTLFYGMAGMGNTLWDCSVFLQDKTYKNAALDMGRKCILYAGESIDGIDGLLFPDMYNLKYSADVGYGTAGILLFLQRMYFEKDENFGFFLDDLILNSGKR